MKLPTQEELQKLMEKYQDKENSVENLENMLKDLFKDSLQTMLEAEMENHLGYEKHSHIGEIYGVELSDGLISNITNKIMEEVFDWQKRPLSSVYPINVCLRKGVS